MNQFNDLIKPDLFLWERLLQALAETGLDSNEGFMQDMQKLALGSNYAITQLGKYPQMLQPLLECDNFELEQDALEARLQQLTDQQEISKQLRLFRHQKLVEIIYLDICRQQSVDATLLHLSQLADVLIIQALAMAERLLSAKHGQPIDELGEAMQLNIIGMGKLGGGELNFSSDIDLICSYSDDGQLKGFGQLSHNQYFANVVKLFKRFLNDATADGFVYRVDLRLRPWGDSGPIVLSHSAFEHYYQLHGREWEQYAMVKARIITGTDSDKKYLQSILRPFVYRRYHDYRVFDGLAQLKHKIDLQAKRKKERNNIKTGPGGIREIEFFVQAFQILKGGRNHHLQTPSLFQAFEVLSEHEVTDQHSLDVMRDCYRFLRTLENRIQMFNDQQTHDIPSNENHQQRISLLMGFETWQQLEQELQRHQAQVNHIFASLFAQHESKDSDHKPPVLHMEEMDEKRHVETLRQLGFDNVDPVHQRLQQFYHSKALLFMSDRAKKRFQVFFPELLKQVAAHQPAAELLDKMLALLSSIAGRSVYFELLYQNIPLLMKLVHLFNSSSWIASEVTRHPINLESLLYPGHLSDRFDQQRLQQELQVQLGNVSGDIELELDILRQFKQAQTIVIATAEIAAEIDTAEVSRYLSELAEIILQAVFDLSRRELVQLHGEPSCTIDNQAITPAFGILAYGKLGGFELHYQSDLDIIFLHDSSGRKQHTSGPRSIDNNTYFSRLAQKIISKVTLLTAAGKLYEIDTRLRPEGASGMLVTSLKAFRQYQHNKAWVWEHQAIIRARFIAGESRIEPKFAQIREEIMTLTREPEDLAREIVSMRNKMYEARNPAEGDIVDIKHSRGCMVDIEFLVQYWVLLHANKFASLCQTTDNNGLIKELYRLELITSNELQLAEVYQTYHRLLHARVLQNQSADISAAEIGDEIGLVTACWQQAFDQQQG